MIIDDILFGFKTSTARFWRIPIGRAYHLGLLYLGEERGGCALMHVYVWEHIVSLSYRTNWWIFMKIGRDEVLIVPYMFCCFSARSVQERIHGGAKIGHRGGGVPFFNELLLQTGRLQQQTECIAII